MSVIPKGSVLGPLLLNIVINNIFGFLKDHLLCNYTNDRSLFFAHEDIKILIESREKISLILSEWLYNIYMTLYLGKM